MASESSLKESERCQTNMTNHGQFLGEGRFPFEVGHLGHTWCQPPNSEVIGEKFLNKKQLFKHFTAFNIWKWWVIAWLFLIENSDCTNGTSLTWGPKSLKPNKFAASKVTVDSWTVSYTWDVQINVLSFGRIPSWIRSVLNRPLGPMCKVCSDRKIASECVCDLVWCVDASAMCVIWKRKKGVREEWRKLLLSNLNRLYSGEFSEVCSEVNFMSLCSFPRDISKSPHVMDNWTTQRYLGHQ